MHAHSVDSSALVSVDSIRQRETGLAEDSDLKSKAGYGALQLRKSHCCMSRSHRAGWGLHLNKAIGGGGGGKSSLIGLTYMFGPCPLDCIVQMQPPAIQKAFLMMELIHNKTLVTF